MKIDGRKNERTKEGLVLDIICCKTRRGAPSHSMRCFGPLKDLAPTRRGESDRGERPRARDMRAITRHVSSICIQEDLSGEGGAETAVAAMAAAAAAANEQPAVGDGCTT